MHRWLFLVSLQDGGREQSWPVTIWVWGGFLSLEHLHVADVVDVELRLEYYYQTLPIESHCQYRRSESHLTDGRVSLCRA